MQEIIGFIIFDIVIIIAIWFGIEESANKEGFKRLISFFDHFVFMFAFIHICLAVIGGVLWVIAWIGILIREILQWLVETVLYPIKFFFGL